ncbi:MAG: UDP-glucose 6-dehydrogenase [Dehalococcoidia bacterium]|nr:UDP-glucose 6-dehydrogenase [Dehalococcoidia bacterium]
MSSEELTSVKEIETDTKALNTLLSRINSREAQVVVMGLGFVGLPMAVEIAEAGFPVVGLDVDDEKVAQLRSGLAVDGEISVALAGLIDSGSISFTTDARAINQADVALICVPVPITRSYRPDLRYLKQAGRTIAKHMGKPKLISLESTSPPGATRDVLMPLLQARGAKVGEDFFLAFAPERIDIGNTTYHLKNIPRLVTGITDNCRQCAYSFYSAFVDEVRRVSSPEVAEMAKVVENAFRFININFVNELALLCDRMGVSVWDVIDAAASKPFAFMPHYPGPGVGGECIPVVPYFLTSKARDVGTPSNLVRDAGAINEMMPRFVVEKLERHLDSGGGLKGCRVLILGVTYKPGVADMRRSPALAVISLFQERGAQVRYHDPFVPQLATDGLDLQSVDLTPEVLRWADAVVVTTPHKGVDYQSVVDNSKLVFDTRNALANFRNSNIIRL